MFFAFYICYMLLLFTFHEFFCLKIIKNFQNYWEIINGDPMNQLIKITKLKNLEQIVWLEFVGWKSVVIKAKVKSSWVIVWVNYVKLFAQTNHWFHITVSPRKISNVIKILCISCNKKSIRFLTLQICKIDFILQYNQCWKNSLFITRII